MAAYTHSALEWSGDDTAALRVLALVAFVDAPRRRRAGSAPVASGAA